MLLMVGASIKLVVDSVAKDEEMSDFSNYLLTRAVGSSMVLLVLSRLCHFGGKNPRSTDRIDVQRLMWIWRALFGIAVVIPFLLSDLSQPLRSLSCVSGLLFVFCVVESAFAHTLEHHLSGEED